jgi:RNA polymerase sigma-70 factor (ECF subfamily)
MLGNRSHRPNDERPQDALMEPRSRERIVSEDMPDKKALTTMLIGVRAGQPNADTRLIEAVYPELKRLARSYLRRERSGHTLQPTALVNEAFVKLFGTSRVQWQNRAQFFAIAANQMRRILIDYARQARAGKRGGANLKVTLSAAEGLGENREEDLLAIDEALTKLEALNPRASKMVELRFFGGLGEEEAAEVLGVSPVTVRRDWRFAKAWLFSQLATSKSPQRRAPTRES